MDAESEEGAEGAWRVEIERRIDRAAPEGVVILAEDMNEGVVFEKGGLRITAFEVDHTPVRPAFRFRVDYGGRSVVLSGATSLWQQPGSRTQRRQISRMKPQRGRGQRSHGISVPLTRTLLR